MIFEGKYYIEVRLSLSLQKCTYARNDFCFSTAAPPPYYLLPSLPPFLAYSISATPKVAFDF